jgi:5-formyltetrahydrofolate cyclo-ligase
LASQDQLVFSAIEAAVFGKARLQDSNLEQPMQRDDTRSCASPPCLAREIAPTYLDPLAVDKQQASDVARWRKTARAQLLTERAALPVAVRQQAAETIAVHLDALLSARFPTIEELTISAWWPIKAELNLRHWLESLLARGARVALPVVVTPAAPLVFRL